MKILMILPMDNTYYYKGNFTKAISYAPLTLTTLASLVPKELRAEITIVDEGVQKPVITGIYDLVLLTAVTSSAPRAYFLANHWKEKGSYVAIGGVHATLMTEEVQKYADTVFVGLGELSFIEFMTDFAKGEPKKRYQHTACTGHLSMPIPRRDLIKKGSYMNIPTIVANRGCANHCEYCSIPKLWGKCGLTRPIGEVIDEIRSLHTKRIILLDPSPTSQPEYAKELFHAFAENNIRWSGLGTIDITEDNELFELLVKSGCEGMLCGFESFSQENLQAVGKKTNQIEQYKQSVARFHQAGIPLLGCFVAGFDHDTKQSLLESIDLIEEIGIDLPRFSVLTPFPGTPLFDKYKKEGRILTENWLYYDTMSVVFQPKHMTPLELQQTFYSMWEKAYRLKRIRKRIHNTQSSKLIKLGANLGFKYYSYSLRKRGANIDVTG